MPTAKDRERRAAAAAVRAAQRERVAIAYGNGAPINVIAKEEGVTVQHIGKLTCEAEAELPELGKLTRRRLALMLAYTDGGADMLLRVAALARHYAERAPSETTVTVNAAPGRAGPPDAQVLAAARALVALAEDAAAGADLDDGPGAERPLDC